MLLLQTIVLILALATSILTVVGQATAMFNVTRGHPDEYSKDRVAVGFATCFLWGLFYYFTH